MKQRIIISLLLFFSLSCLAVEPDMIVLHSGESLKVYNLDFTPGGNIYYTLQETSDSPVQKIIKEDVLIIKKADGTKIDPCNPVEKETESKSEMRSHPQVNPNAHEPITVNSIESDFMEIKVKDFKSPQKFILIEDGNGNILNVRLLSDKEKTVSIAKPRKGMKYNYDKIIIPEYILIRNERFTITEIDETAFYTKGREKIKSIIFPETLESIGKGAFVQCWNLQSIVLPDSLISVGERAFIFCGTKCNTFKTIYIPKNVKEIGAEAFIWIGKNVSPYNKYYQGSLGCMPDWMTVGNCTYYGIDENAVEDYERRIGIRK